MGLYRWPSDLHDLAFFRRKHAVDLADRLIRYLLHLLLSAAGFVLAHLAVFFGLFDCVHAVPPHMPHRDARLFGVLVSGFFAWLVAFLQGKYYFEIMLPGSIVGLIVGFATQRYDARPQTPAAG